MIFFGLLKFWVEVEELLLMFVVDRLMIWLFGVFGVFVFFRFVKLLLKMMFLLDVLFIDVIGLLNFVNGRFVYVCDFFC